MSLTYNVNPDALEKLSDEELERVNEAWAIEKARVLDDYRLCCTNTRYIIGEKISRKLELLGEE